jgi:hypothetical protein
MIALIAMGTVPALANPSIGDITPEVTEVEIIQDEENPTSEEIVELIKDDDWSCEAIEATPENYDNEDVKASVIAVNSDDAVETPAETVARLMEHQPEGSDANIPEDLSSYRYVTSFVDLVLTDGDNAFYTDENDTMTILVTLQSDAMLGVQKEDLDDYLIMQINPASGELFFTKIDEDSFDSETGSFTAKFHVFGPFTIIQKSVDLVADIGE